jgi:hypothetical protein
MSDEVAAIRARLAAVPAAPWEAYHWLVRRPIGGVDEDGMPLTDVLATTINDDIADFVASAPGDIATLLTRLDAAQADAAALRGAIKAHSVSATYEERDRTRWAMYELADAEHPGAALLAEVAAARTLAAAVASLPGLAQESGVEAALAAYEATRADRR